MQMFGSSVRLLYIRTNRLGRISKSSSSLFPSKRLLFEASDKPLLSVPRICSPLSFPSIGARVSGSVLSCSRLEHTMAATSEPKSVHDFTVKDAKGNDVDLSIYKGKTLMIVNVASQW